MSTIASQLDKQNPQNNSQTKAQGETQDKLVKTPTEDVEELKYTENQWRSMQQKLRKENQILKDTITERDTTISANESLIDDNEALKVMVAELNGKIEEGIPEDAKDAFTKWGKETMAYSVEKQRFQKELKQRDSELKGYRGAELKETATKLAAEHGVDVEELLLIPDVRDMKLYAFEHRNPEKVEKPERDIESVVKAERPLPPLVNPGGVQSNAELWKNYGKPGFQATPDDHKRIKEIKDKALQGG